MALHVATNEDAQRAAAAAEAEEKEGPPKGYVDADEMIELQRRVQDMLDCLGDEIGKQWMTLRLKLLIERVEEYL